MFELSERYNAFTFLQYFHGKDLEHTFEIRLLQDPGGLLVAYPRSLLIHRGEIYTGKEKRNTNSKIKSWSDLSEVISKHNEHGIMGVFFTPNSPYFEQMGGSHSRDLDINRISSQFVDIDAPKQLRRDKQALESWKERQVERLLNHQMLPSFIIDTKNGVHGYYLLSDEAELDLFRPIQAQLVECFEGDKACINESRVMRLPYFNHIKNALEPFMTTVKVWNPERRYSQREIMESFPALKEEVKRSLTSIRPTNHEIVEQVNATEQPEKSYDGKHIAIIEAVKNHLDPTSETDEKLRCRCCLPEHPDKKPSVWFSKETFWYHCSGCGANIPLDELATSLKWKDVIDLLNISRLDIAESVKKIRDKAIDVSSMPELELTDDEKAIKQQILDDVLRKFEEELGQSPNSNYVRQFEDLITILVKKLPAEFLVPMQMGGGKSLVTQIFIIEMVKLDPDFGLILVVERKENVRRIAKTINKAVRKEIAYPMYGFEKEECQSNELHGTDFIRCMSSKVWKKNRCAYTFRDVDCKYYRQKFEFKQYPVIIMTHQRMYLEAVCLLGNTSISSGMGDYSLEQG
ncbi:hypothetical protein H1S01_17385 [Heliobacterium chlorum]|uniref:Helicase/UvrB N-terminal domain-containing protein n=1 Tax=Heliobacterium chlorum TaxID=2698 RepID=A0ABR7T7Q1_HELCL|nr:hypothetical protein [Heliobacterium chlorum]MBC9786237.1 hypothetical protein [Heliobacterium chlorum]